MKAAGRSRSGRGMYALHLTVAPVRLQRVVGDIGLHQLLARPAGIRATSTATLPTPTTANALWDKSNSHSIVRMPVVPGDKLPWPDNAGEVVARDIRRDRSVERRSGKEDLVVIPLSGSSTVTSPQLDVSQKTRVSGSLGPDTLRIDFLVVRGPRRCAQGHSRSASDQNISTSITSSFL